MMHKIEKHRKRESGKPGFSNAANKRHNPKWMFENVGRLIQIYPQIQKLKNAIIHPHHVLVGALWVSGCWAASSAISIKSSRPRVPTQTEVSHDRSERAVSTD
ncbi:hypothetical protein [Roseateles sp.]|uniref:hypothetical protein n=1 Tax=Roseateles sp. TaxID=1971397 RepID=UPI003D12CBE3